MAQVASRELRNQTRSLLDRVEAGERITITVEGRPVAELIPTAVRRRWMPRDQFARDILRHQADSTLTADLAALADESTDDLSW